MSKFISRVESIIDHVFISPLVQAYLKENKVNICFPAIDGKLAFKNTDTDNSSENNQFVTLDLRTGTDSPMKKWVYWCSNYPPAEQWIPEFDPDDEGEYLLSVWARLAKKYDGDSLMNHFYRELSISDQMLLENYVKRLEF